jgi:rare lipoprotein A
MKNNILLGVFVSFIALFGLTDISPKHKKYKKYTSIHDSVKVDSVKIDSVKIDTLVLNLELYQENAHASYYHDRFTGRKTASGAVFNNNELTCAHKTLSFGTKLKITSIKTGKSVEVIVTDRGPFSKDRDIDLSKKAFMKIAPNRYGSHIRVNIEIINE